MSTERKPGDPIPLTEEEKERWEKRGDVPPLFQAAPLAEIAEVNKAKGSCDQNTSSSQPAQK